MPRYREDLDRVMAGGCQVPGCTHRHAEPLMLDARCHPGKGLTVSYWAGSGVLRLTCKACGLSVLAVAVAGRPPGEAE